MKMVASTSIFIFIFLVYNNLYITISSPVCPSPDCSEHAIPIYKEDIDMIQFALNLEHLEADFFLYAALGYGLDEVAPYLVMGGPPPIGAQKANLDFLTENIITEFGFEEVGHLRSIFSNFIFPFASKNDEINTQ